MENQVLVAVLKGEMRPDEVIDVMRQINQIEGVLIVKTFERIVEDALPIPEK